MKLAPIAFFAYKRPEHVKRSLESLAQNESAGDSELFIFCDGAKKTEDEEAVALVRQVVKSRKWCGAVHIIEREQNLGLANSIIQGVSEIVNIYGKIIVLEDDMITSRYFLNFINNALDLYEKEEKVACVSGFCNPISIKNSYFIRGAEMWGWGTWKRAWAIFEPDASKLLKELKSQKLIYRFEMNGTVASTQILRDQIDGIVSSWGARWCASVFLAGKLNLYPPKTLIKNIGRDGSGTHEEIAKFEEPDVYNEPVYLSKIEVKESELAFHLLVDYFYKKRGRSFIVKQWANKFLPKACRVLLKKTLRRFL